ncbi:hypothetical protein CF327_g7546 [Tilletia walkeri]|nr:hypothetical protein CF327_g7546 [Tilletia walkeri]
MPHYSYTHNCDSSIPERTESNKTPSPSPTLGYSPSDPRLNFRTIKSEVPDNFHSSPVTPLAVRKAIDSSFHHVGNTYLNMSPGARLPYFNFFVEVMWPEIQALIAEKTGPLEEQVEQLKLELDNYKSEFETQLRTSGTSFNFAPDHAWSQNLTRDDIRNLDEHKGRSMACALVQAADGNLNHPYLTSNPLYKSCMRRYYYS